MSRRPVCSFLFQLDSMQNLARRPARIEKNQFLLLIGQGSMRIKLYQSIIHPQPLGALHDRCPDARLTDPIRIFYDTFQRAELQEKLCGGFRSYFICTADIIGVSPVIALKSAYLHGSMPNFSRTVCSVKIRVFLPRYRSTDTRSEIS